ncbi:peptidylprolyl isomerase [Thalassotalea psychrophila]|uniref:Peptidyl-prolyl cis-trans isomerase n=1 Tax=Thalassotalea psychrophila TaxID=3065647 RepID=A0ABY9TUR4_9GAMM|nr:peptidylprolyl isomerase [Colwelliaceae bacterium SQ149]
MMNKTNLSLFTFLFAGIIALSTPAQATVVLFDTNMGQIEVNLLDEHTPETVNNFIRYIETGSYQNSIIHRSMTNFIIQGGGFNYNIETGNVVDEQKFTSVENEPVFSNVRGTIAMAKQSNDPNSATNQWFFNTQNNSANLDNQNDGFTVFGVVTLGMDIVDQINELPQYEILGLPAFTDTPLQTAPAGDGITEEHYVLVESITITNANQDTQPDLPPESTAKKDDQDDSSGGGSLFWILSILGFGLLRRAAK